MHSYRLGHPHFMESESAREPSLAANECAPRGVGFEFSALRMSIAKGKAAKREPEDGRHGECA
jgi:hypothetical protein